ncbi:hypothetical protein SASPL_130984 [Salvia splendens]|uniref:Uncharacterized protein n=1 Tax=Salvia splendens TaxID=180675 RepID=A0A8X8ZK68_SALSN|nr:hypothetical protein SASPL_130984 [Salvia splendens]
MACLSQKLIWERDSELLYHAGMGLWTLLEGFLLLANALAILNEDRFLAPRGWSFQEYSGIKRNSFKGQILGLIYATQYLRVPLMLLNLLCIIVKVSECIPCKLGDSNSLLTHTLMHTQIRSGGYALLYSRYFRGLNLMVFYSIVQFYDLQLNKKDGSGHAAYVNLHVTMIYDVV